jgi:transcriptional regulator with XRE-family HTH domain
MKTPHTTLSTICERLRDHVQVAGLQKTARMAGMSSGTINRFHKRNVEPTAATVDAIARALGYGFKLVRITPHRHHARRAAKRPLRAPTTRKPTAAAA